MAAGNKPLASIACGYSQLTSLAAATALTVPSNASWAMIQCQDQPVRWRDDGTDPTTSVGMYMAPLDTLIYDGTKLGSIKFIEVAASAKLNISFYS